MVTSEKNKFYIILSNYSTQFIFIYIIHTKQKEGKKDQVSQINIIQKKTEDKPDNYMGEEGDMSMNKKNAMDILCEEEHKKTGDITGIDKHKIAICFII